MPRIKEMPSLRTLNTKIFWESMPPEPPSKERLQPSMVNRASNTTLGTPLCKKPGYAPVQSMIFASPFTQSQQYRQPTADQGAGGPWALKNLIPRVSRAVLDAILKGTTKKTSKWERVWAPSARRSVNKK